MTGIERQSRYWVTEERWQKRKMSRCLRVGCRQPGSGHNPGNLSRQRVEWIKPEPPFTAISPASQVHANHNEALNSSIRRRSPCLS